MLISEAVLFISAASKVCIPVVSLVQRSGLPITIVRLDTPEAREKAMNGKLFSVKHVPCLVVVYNDGTLRQMIGEDKVTAWITATMQPPTPPPQPEVPKVIATPNSDESEEESPPKKRKKPQKKPKKSKKKKSEEPELSNLSFNFPSVKDPEQRKQHELQLSQMNNRKSSSDEEQEFSEDDEEGTLILDTYDEGETYKSMKKTPQIKGLEMGNTNSASMESIQAKADRMRKEWEQSQAMMG